MTEDRIHELFREMRDEPLPADSLARVRLAVAERTQARTLRFPWRIAAALLATASVVLVVLLSRSREPIGKPAAPVVVRQRSAPPAKPATPQLRARQPTERKAPRRGKTAPRDTLLIRIETPDPDVVILLVGEGAGS
jgi:hypothetical protein